MTAVNMRYSKDYDIRVDRATRWGNPFKLGRDGNRQEVVTKYYEWLQRQVASGAIGLRTLAALDGKRLGCWCAPRACHADVLTGMAAWAAHELKAKEERT